MIDGFTTEEDTFVMPSLMEDLPVIHLPGHTKFSSFKNTFQEFCQKRHQGTPTYKTEKKENGFISCVSFSLSYVSGKIIYSTIREAEHRVAYDALQLLGYIKDVDFEIFSSAAKRKAGNSEIGPQYTAKQLKQISQYNVQRNMIRIQDVEVDGNTTFKSQLNEIAQKKKLPLPIYNSVLEEEGFASIVQFGACIFRSQPMETKKEADQHAAEICLKFLKGEKLSEEESGGDNATTSYQATNNIGSNNNTIEDIYYGTAHNQTNTDTKGGNYNNYSNVVDNSNNKSYSNNGGNYNYNGVNYDNQGNVVPHNLQNNIPPNNMGSNNIPPNNMGTNNISTNNMVTNNIPPNNVVPNNIPPNNVVSNNIPTNNMVANNIPANNMVANNFPTNNMATNVANTAMPHNVPYYYGNNFSYPAAYFNSACYNPASYIGGYYNGIWYGGYGYGGYGYATPGAPGT